MCSEEALPTLSEHRVSWQTEAELDLEVAPVLHSMVPRSVEVRYKGGLVEFVNGYERLTESRVNPTLSMPCNPKKPCRSKMYSMCVFSHSFEKVCLKKGE